MSSTISTLISERLWWEEEKGPSKFSEKSFNVTLSHIHVFFPIYIVNSSTDCYVLQVTAFPGQQSQLRLIRNAAQTLTQALLKYQALR